MIPEIPQKMTQKEALELFRSLKPVKPDELWGTWVGEEIKTDHPMDGLLTAVGWQGKTFVDMENVHPLLYKLRKNGKVRYADVGKLPIGFFMNFPRWLIKTIFFFVAPFVTTKKSSTRIREILCEGEVSATMVYDKIPMLEHFRRFDDNTLLGLADLKSVPDKKFYFTLKNRRA
ncbi:MAG: DUF4334 domain-containing protein [Chitinispirillales bacterium]|jgi:hypothetical protein|nr:DUF4334 domain-containing protein [Chitinispirillales bacterium]